VNAPKLLKNTITAIFQAAEQKGLIGGMWDLSDISWEWKLILSNNPHMSDIVLQSLVEQGVKHINPGPYLAHREQMMRRLLGEIRSPMSNTIIVVFSGCLNFSGEIRDLRSLGFSVAFGHNFPESALPADIYSNSLSASFVVNWGNILLKSLEAPMGRTLYKTPDNRPVMVSKVTLEKIHSTPPMLMYLREFLSDSLASFQGNARISIENRDSFVLHFDPPVPEEESRVVAVEADRFLKIHLKTILTEPLICLPGVDFKGITSAIFSLKSQHQVSAFMPGLGKSPKSKNQHDKQPFQLYVDKVYQSLQVKDIAFFLATFGISDDVYSQIRFEKSADPEFNVAVVVFKQPVAAVTKESVNTVLNFTSVLRFRSPESKRSDREFEITGWRFPLDEKLVKSLLKECFGIRVKAIRFCKDLKPLDPIYIDVHSDSISVAASISERLLEMVAFSKGVSVLLSHQNTDSSKDGIVAIQSLLAKLPVPLTRKHKIVNEGQRHVMDSLFSKAPEPKFFEYFSPSAAFVTVRLKNTAPINPVAHQSQQEPPDPPEEAAYWNHCRDEILFAMKREQTLPVAVQDLAKRLPSDMREKIKAKFKLSGFIQKRIPELMLVGSGPGVAATFASFVPAAKASAKFVKSAVDEIEITGPKEHVLNVFAVLLSVHVKTYSIPPGSLTNENINHYKLGLQTLCADFFEGKQFVPKGSAAESRADSVSQSTQDEESVVRDADPADASDSSSDDTVASDTRSEIGDPSSRNLRFTKVKVTNNRTRPRKGAKVPKTPQHPKGPLSCGVEVCCLPGESELEADWRTAFQVCTENPSYANICLLYNFMQMRFRCVMRYLLLQCIF
jgi:hypothetical protein